MKLYKHKRIRAHNGAVIIYHVTTDGQVKLGLCDCKSKRPPALASGLRANLPSYAPPVHCSFNRWQTKQMDGMADGVKQCGCK